MLTPLRHSPGPTPDPDDGARYYLVEDLSGKIPDEIYCSAHLIGEFAYLKKHDLESSVEIYITLLEDEGRFDCHTPGCCWATSQAGPTPCPDCVAPLARECARATAPSGSTYTCLCSCHDAGGRS